MKISVQELKERLDQGESIRLVDVRTQPEFHSERVDHEDLDHQPLDSIEALEARSGERIYLICQTGHRSALAQRRLQAKGHDVVSVDGGLNAWKAAKLPVTRTAGTFPIMRQVQIAAGLLILTGTLGSIFIAPGWIWLAVFVGAGLTQAGLTGFCGLALLLGRMPWNKAMQTNKA